MRRPDFELEHPSGVCLSRSLTEDALLASLPSVKSSKSHTHTGWAQYWLPAFQEGDWVISTVLRFSAGFLDMSTFADLNPKFGTRWSEWSPEKELSRANSIQSWLKSKGFAVGAQSWGSIWAGFDEKGGRGSGRVRFAP
jgi:hypothetical protein